MRCSVLAIFEVFAILFATSPSCKTLYEIFKMILKVIPNFEDIFPEEKSLEVLEYLKKIPKDLLLKSIGFFNTHPLPNYHNFFSNPAIANSINYRIKLFQNNFKYKTTVEIISPLSYLKMSELILSNIEDFNKIGDLEEDYDLIFFKAFLKINSKYKEFNVDFNNDNGIDSFIDFVILNSFQLNEISIYENNNFDFFKLVYTTIYKVESLLNFLDFTNNIKVKELFIESFGLNTEKDFLYQMKYFFASLLISKEKNQYLFNRKEFEFFNLVENIAANKITEDEDFTELKKTPIYFINEDTFSIINYFFAIDLFYRSSKFRLKEIFIKENIDVGNFFTYYTTNFSEKFLMKNLLNNFFSNKYFNKKDDSNIEKVNEPDYYVKYNNTLILFENKDVLINKKVKASTNIQPINELLKEKFFQSEKKGVGIKQLINSIELLSKHKFDFDNRINNYKKIEIIPILLVHDRIFQSPGINYRLNKWFEEEISEKNIQSNNKFNIRPLVLLDIDTLIMWSKNVENNFTLFKELLISHIKSMKENKKKYYNNNALLVDYLQRVTKPISARKTPFYLSKDEFKSSFSDLLKK